MAAPDDTALAVACEAAERWAIFDPDPVTRGRIDALVDRRDPDLIELFTGRLAFGTAGLRAPVGPGPNRMNMVVVQQTTTAVVRWLSAQGLAEPRLVVGHDARTDSARFARGVAAAARAGGADVRLADEAVPTPVCALAVLGERGDAGVVITASHNPATDNGYKLYLGNGLQLVPPADREIEALIGEVAAVWGRLAPAIEPFEGPLVEAADWVRAHREAAASARLTGVDASAVQVAYTPMHGVGGLATVEAFAAAGLAQPLIVEDQFEPDPQFPTVRFPNPEEPGAFDLAIETAVSERADAALAHDPDADRLAVAVPGRSGGFVALSGNELGTLLADHVLAHTAGDDRLVARSVVSSRQLDAMADAAGVECHVGLTGFKWIARPIVDRPDRRFVFGYEEALGYCVGDRVRDKDGITAAVVAVEMLAELQAAGRSVWDRLDELAATHGVHADRPITIWLDDLADASVVLARLEADPPTELAGAPVVASGPVGLGALPATPGMHLLSDDGTSVIIRPSGTEPKLKTYVEVVEPVPSATVAGVAAARQRAADRLERVAADLAPLLRV